MTEADLLKLKTIQEGLNRGVSWRSMGYILVGRPDGKAAKKAAKQLARKCQRELILREINERASSSS